MQPGTNNDDSSHDVGDADALPLDLNGLDGPDDIKPPSRESVIMDEIQCYSRLKSTMNEDAVNEWQPLAMFWREQEKRDRFPTICKLARKLLATPASSVYSKRLFSEFGNVYESKRSRLLPGRAENIVFCHHNLPILDRVVKEESKAKAKKAEQ